MTTATDLLFDHLDHRRDAPAFTLGAQTLSFGELDHRARRYAAGLQRLGIGRGDRAVAILGSSLSLVEILVGHHRLGVVHVPVNTRYGPQEIAHILTDAEPSVVIVDTALKARAIVDDLELPPTVRAVITVGDGPTRGDQIPYEEVLADEPARDLEPPSDDDLALFIYTSGTTGPSKGVEHTFSSVVAGIDALTRHWRWTPKDRLVLALPLFHVHGLCIGVHGTLIRGNHTEIHRGFDARRVARAMGRGGTIFMGVPTMHTRLVAVMEEDPELARAFSKARLVTSGSAALRPDVFRRFEELTGLRILERYGMSETMLTISNPYDGERRCGAIGFAVPGTEVRIVDEDDQPVITDEIGEIQVRGPSVMQGYWGLPDKTKASFTDDGFFRTGDVARRDDDGYIHIVGRRSVDIIKSGGFKISAREIEEVLHHHPDLDEVAVVGLDDPEWGQRIAAAVVPREGVEKSEQVWLEELGDLCGESLADFKCPRQVLVYRDGLPRNALGKIQKPLIVREGGLGGGGE